jgi:hypothetical protein
MTYRHFRLAAAVCIAYMVLAFAVFGQAPKSLPGEKFTPPAPGERQPEKLKVGDAAPDFTLPDPSGKKEVKLSSFQGKKPVVLIFGSCT